MSRRIRALLIAAAAFLLVGCALLPGASISPAAVTTATPAETPTAAATEQSGPIVIVGQVVREESQQPRYEVDVRWPQIEWNDDPRIQAFNQAAETLAKEEMRQFKEAAAAISPEMDIPGVHSGLTMNYAIANDTNGLISVLFQVSVYMDGAAHPNPYSHAINYDLAAGRVLALDDLFQPGSEYLNVLSEVSLEDLRARGVLSWEEGAQPKAENFRVWNITPEGLRVTFDAYQVAPYAAGPQAVVVPYDRLKEFARADGPLAPFYP